MDLDAPRFVPRSALPQAAELRCADARFAGLWTVGSLAELAAPTVAVVGSRAPSDLGVRIAHEIGAGLAAAGVCVLSGLAIGIDAAAHRGALAGGGATIGILGGGHRCFFPRRNRDLAAAMIAAGGAVLSPFPPDHPAHPPQFLQRNGIVAQLADAVVVVEAAARSGALNTAHWASDLSREVMAVPGDVDRPKVAGCLALLRDGATLVRNAADVLAAIGLDDATAAPKPAPRLPANPVERQIVVALDDGPHHAESLASALDIAPAALWQALFALETAGRIASGAEGYALVR
jgi:DNA processing protein